jgi:hypothetical protein
MNTTKKQVHEALKNHLQYIGLSDNFEIVQDNKPKSKKFIFCKKRPQQVNLSVTPPLTYEELNAYMRGINDIKQGKVIL